MNNTLTMDSVREASLDRAKLQSATIDFLRFPMAVAVVMIHVNPQVMPLNEADFPLFSADGLFNVVAIGLSHVLARIAVPVFFLLSGMLFFLNMRQLSWGGVPREAQEPCAHTDYPLSALEPCAVHCGCHVGCGRRNKAWPRPGKSLGLSVG